MAIQYEGPGGQRPGMPDEPHGRSILGVLLAFVSAAGITLCIGALYQGMALIMGTEGGFVATGGPYEIVHPAPDWVWLVPVSILAGAAFCGLSVYASSRGWGVNLLLFTWSALFISLGWNFLRLGFAPPEDLQGAWAWIMCGVLFWAMGLWPLVGLLVSWRRARANVFVQQSAAVQRAWGVPTLASTTTVYVVAQVIGVACGVAGAVALFAAITGV